MEQLKGAKFDGGKPRPSFVPVEADVPMLCELADAYGVSLDELVGRA